MFLLDTNVVSELRRPRPHGAVLDWITDVPGEQLFVSAVTVGEIQAGIEITRKQDVDKAEQLEAWLDRVMASYSVLPMDAPTFRQWARIMHRRSDTITEDAHDRRDGYCSQTDGGDPERARLRPAWC